MKRNVWLWVVMAGLFMGIGSTAFAETKVRLQCVYPEKAYVGQNTIFFADRVKELTGGEVNIKVFWPDQLVKTNEAFDAMAKGMIDAYAGSMLYFAGFVPEVNCEWLPFGWANPKEAQELYEKHGWLDLMRQATLKHGVHYVAPVGVASMGLITKFPVQGVDDLKGKKIRAVGMEAKIIDVLGASPVAIAGAEQYMALKQGTVDGTNYPFYTINNYKFYEVANHIIRPALFSPGIVEILINQKLYASLSEKNRKAIDQAGWETFLRTVELNPKYDEEAYQVCKEKNVAIIDLSHEVVDQLRKKTLPLWEEIASKSDISAKLVASLKAYLKEKGIKIE
ncbi:TRAP transporter substrate-binding protein [Desulfatirhabdium butyrativorans]|uniref:TRAP transporter substrate-binding protein n=1 Tax=Desulfatirhabdium butyrativorans TaxID=340467 RepID=UPI0004019E62|nr:TRAP transporter substrate-binding protein DctP [Desulfatirhabdium butyrativorans]